ncbi:MAG: DUF72 domain-containing protein [Thermoproteota archaeon]
MSREEKNWNSDLIRKICQEHNLIHAVDPFQSKPALVTNTLYFRLHGLGESKYQYKFSNENLNQLLDICKASDANKIFVMFNNYQSYQDAERFYSLVTEVKLKDVPWRAEAVVDTIEVDFPITQEELLRKCGNWWCWVEPDKSVRVREVFQHIEPEKFEDEKQLLESVREAYPEL